jgi:protein tyrosine/serine phosphatase
MPIHPLRPTRLGASAARFIVAVALIAPLPLAAASASDRTSDSRVSVPAETTPAIGIDNFGRVDARLYRGAQPGERDFSDLKALGVKTVVNLTSDDADPDEQAMAEAAGLTYVQIPMTTRAVPTAAQLAEFLGIVNDPASGPVFVHCVGGKHRTGVMTAAYRITHDGWSAEQAFREMKQYKFGSDFLHPEFKKFVYSYR